MTFNSKRNQKEFKIKWKARQIKIAIDCCRVRSVRRALIYLLEKDGKECTRIE